MTGPIPAEHSAYAFKSGRCRCDVCRELRVEQDREHRAVRVARLRANPGVYPHGNSNTYLNWGCRCGPCCDAYSKNQRGRRGDLSRRGTVLSSGPARRYGLGVQPFGREWLDDVRDET